MKCLFFLSGESLSLGKAEVSHLLGVSLEDHGRLLLGDVRPARLELGRRLAFTKSVHRLLFSVPLSRLDARMERYAWGAICKGSFCVRVSSVGRKKSVLSSGELAGYVWRALRNPRVDLERPDCLITLFVDGSTVYCGLHLFSIMHDFEERKAHKRAVLHPTSLHPKLARCLVNLAGPLAKVIIDPFCGTGGILIEAGLMGLGVTGFDLYKVMLVRTRKNFRKYKIHSFTLQVADALGLNARIEYVVTDVPYGMNTSIWEQTGSGNVRLKLDKNLPEKRIKVLRGFYSSFLRTLRKILGKRGVVVFPHYAKAGLLLRRAGFSVEGKYTQYIHSSLRREIFVITPRKDGD